MRKTIKSKRLPHVCISFEFTGSIKIEPVVEEYLGPKKGIRRHEWGLEEAVEVHRMLSSTIPKAINYLRSRNIRIPDSCKEFQSITREEKVYSHQSDNFNSDWRAEYKGAVFESISEPEDD